MKLRFFSSLLICSLVFSLLIPPSQPTLYHVSAQEALTLEQAQEAIQLSRGFFTENKGQWDPNILFMGDTDFGKVAFTPQAIYYQMDQSQDPIQLSFVGAGSPEIEGLELLPHYHNYMIGNDPSKWGIECRNYAQVTYTNIWEGIDLAYFFSPEGLKYEYYVHPGANLQDLQVQVRGAKLLAGHHCLELFTPGAALKDDQLLVYGKDSLAPLEASFHVCDDIFSFAIDDSISRNETIVIDPIVYSTYLGGTNYDTGYAIAVDALGCAYVTGQTHSSDFPMDSVVGGSQAPGYSRTITGEYDVFVVKLNASGTQLLYSTYLGGTNYDAGYSIAVDALGCAYVCGSTSCSDFPMSATVGGSSAPGFDQAYHAGEDTFVVKLDASGSQLLYSTYLGGSNDDRGKSIVVDALGQAYITGHTGSVDFPMDSVVGGSQAPGYSKTITGNYDAFVVKLNASGTQLLYSTYLGGTANNFGKAIVVDSYGQAYLTGFTSSSDFPMSVMVGDAPAPGYDKSHNGSNDAFVVKLNASGTQLVYSTYLGGSGSEGGEAIVVDATGCVYITGSTGSLEFPMDAVVGGTPAPGYDQSHNGMIDVFLLKLNANGTQLLYSTFVGGSKIDTAYSLALDFRGQAYLTGLTTSNDFSMDMVVGGPPTSSYDRILSGSYDAFVVKLDASGTRLLHFTYLGGSDNDGAYGIAVDFTGQVYVAGYTLYSDFPMDIELGGAPAPGYDQTYNTVIDAFAVKLDLTQAILDIGASANAVSYTKGTQPVLTLSLANIGDRSANYCVVLITLPSELQFRENQLLVSTPAPGNARLFQVGGLPADGSVTFPIYVEVVSNVPVDSLVTLGFEASCIENVSATTTLDLLLIPLSDEPDPTPPHLRIWAEVNKPSFFKGEEALLMVTVVNQGELVATNTRVKMTLPQELSFLRASRYRSVALTPSLIEFELGAIAPNSVQTFQVDVKVLVAVSQLRSIPVHFDVNCTEKSYDFAHVLLQLIPQRSGRPDLYLGLYYRNASWDPQTASVYILQDTPLEIDFVLTGAQAPYELSIDWGDGETEVLSQQTDLRQTLRHQFKSKGKKAITVKVTDQLQRSKTATLHMEVR